MKFSSIGEIPRCGIVHTEFQADETDCGYDTETKMLDAVAINADCALIISEQPSAFRKMNLLVKRLFDVVISSVAIVVLSPFFIVIVLLIKRETPGSAIFSQERWGLGGRKIRVYKFRTMYDDKGDARGVVQTVEGDSRITRIGKKLRQKNIDELPQLFNVLKGEMSLVGPRCHPVGMLAVGMLYEDLVPQYHARHLMRPGITGLAQMNGFRGETAKLEPAVMRVENDLRYIAEFNLASDLKIIAGTVKNELFAGTGN